MFQKKQKNKACQIFGKTNISYLLICTRTCAYQGVRNVRFLEKFVVLCFLETPVLRFALLAYYRGILNLERRFALGSCCHGNSQDIVFRAATHCIAQILHIFSNHCCFLYYFNFFRKNRIRMRRLFYLKNIWKRKHFWLNMIPNFWRFESVFFNFSRSFQIVLHDSAKRSLEIFPQKQTEFLNNFTKGHFKWLSLESTYMH